MMLWLLVLTSLVHADPEPGHACDLKIQQLRNIDFANDPSPSAAFRVRRNRGGACPFFLTVDNGGAPSFSTRRLLHSDHTSSLGVQVCADASCSRVLKHFPEAGSSSDVISGEFVAGGPDEIELSFRPRLDPLDYERFGHYDATFNLRLYRGSPAGSYDHEDTDSFRLSHYLPKRIDLSLVSPGSPFDPAATSKTLDFGALRTGAARSFDLVLKYNAGYKVVFSSQNLGQLKNQRTGARIDYRLTIDGVPIFLKYDNKGWIRGIGYSPRGGRRFAGEVVIGEVGRAEAGAYQDVITITVSATE